MVANNMVQNINMQFFSCKSRRMGVYHVSRGRFNEQGICGNLFLVLDILPRMDGEKCVYSSYNGNIQ